MDKDSFSLFVQSSLGSARYTDSSSHLFIVP